MSTIPPPLPFPVIQIHLENMLRVTRAGALVLPAMPGWCHRPLSLDDLVQFVVSRISDQLGVELPARRWVETPAPATATETRGAF